MNVKSHIQADPRVDAILMTVGETNEDRHALLLMMGRKGLVEFTFDQGPDECVQSMRTPLLNVNLTARGLSEISKLSATLGRKR